MTIWRRTEIVEADRVPREWDHIQCPRCGCNAPRIKSSPNALKLHECGRSYPCCSRTFECESCGWRVDARASAPEMD